MPDWNNSNMRNHALFEPTDTRIRFRSDVIKRAESIENRLNMRLMVWCSRL